MPPFRYLVLIRPALNEHGTLARKSGLPIACREKGVQAGPVDCLIAAVCIEQDFPLLTADRDFLRIAHDSELVVLPPLKEAG